MDNSNPHERVVRLLNQLREARDPTSPGPVFASDIADELEEAFRDVNLSYRRDTIVNRALNKLAFDELEEFEPLLWEAIPEGDELYYICADVDGLKSVNDQHGHVKGNMVIEAAGELLLEMERLFRRLTLFRTGGDEFAAIAYLDPAAGSIKEVLKKVQEEFMSKRILVDKTLQLQVHISIGFAKHERGLEGRKTLERADKAAGICKLRGDRMPVLWDPELGDPKISSFRWTCSNCNARVSIMYESSDSPSGTPQYLCPVCSTVVFASQTPSP